MQQWTYTQKKQDKLKQKERPRKGRQKVAAEGRRETILKLSYRFSRWTWRTGNALEDQKVHENPEESSFDLQGGTKLSPKAYAIRSC